MPDVSARSCACFSVLPPRSRARAVAAFLPRSIHPPPPTLTQSLPLSLSSPLTTRFTTLLTLPNSASVRRLGPTTWVTAVIPASEAASFEDARSKGFSKNFDYISTHGYAMTAPVLTRVGSDGAVRVSFLLPESVGNSPADGSGQGVVTEAMPAQTVVVRPLKGAAAALTSWDGLADAARGLAAEAGTAQLALASPPPPEPADDGGSKADGSGVGPAGVGPGVYYAGFSSPMTAPADKYSEVWLPLAAGTPIPGAAP
jgi:hypothetical protein